MEPIRERVARAKRCPKRMTITLSNLSFDLVHELALEQGRSASNLACYLIDKGLEVFHKR